MWSKTIIFLDVACDPLTAFFCVIIFLDVHLLIFKTSPEPLDNYIVQGSAFSVHAYANIPCKKFPGKCFTCELGSLIGIENLRFTITPHGCIKRRHAEMGIHCIRQLPREYLA